MNPSLYLIDGHAQIYRAYYAMESLKSNQGTHTGAAFGFARMLADILANQRPDGLIAVFDSPGKTFRHDAFPEYKATRKPPPPELVEQIPLVKDIVAGYRVPVFALEGYEADDILGALTRQARDAGWDVVLVTGDKDCGQLLRDGVRIYDPAKGLFIDAKTFTEKKGIPPEKLTDLMGLWGDSSDNIPGVPGIGEKIGVQLINEYGSLENLLDNADKIKGKRGEVLRENRDLAILSKKLATIDVNVPVALDLDAAKPHAPDVEKLRELFGRLNFKSLLSRLDAFAAVPGDSGAAVPPLPSAQEECEYRLVDDEETFAAFLAELQQQDCFAFDTETTGLDPLLAELVGLGFSWKERSGWYLPFKGPAGSRILPPEYLDRVKPVFEDAAIGKTGHNVRFDALVLRHAGIRLAGVRFDSLIASSLVDGHLVDHGLKTLSRRFFDVEMTPIQNLIGSGRNQSTLDNAPVADVCAYCSADADISYRLYTCLGPLLDERGARTLFETVEMPLSSVLTEMQATGIRIDAGLLAGESAETGELLESLTQEIHELAGHPFNIASPKQLAAILFEEMGLPVVRKTQTGASTDESVLQELAHLHNAEIATRILEYRMYAKLKNTYLDALPKMVNPETGRLHTSFSQVRTATGRLASSNPNLQNIPVRTERGRAVRAAFIPEAGWKMLAADYSQVELRVLAAFSGDPTLAKAFGDDMDIHRVVAAEVNGIAPDEVTKEQRSAAKAVNFGIIYGQSAHGLSAVT
ncbi:MAG: DNA polymerase I, partial [Planctomycetota bacterium]|nr:DNA polymerase I [Planctomycetota bacterium]